jgi:hypothetical protein
MKALVTKIGEIYFYIQDGTIYKISSKNDDEGCAKKGVEIVKDANTEVQVPSIAVTKGEEETKYFLVDYITNGDKYDNGFTKHPHTEPAGGQSIAEYYKALCEEEIKKAIENNPTASYKLFENNKSLLGIPLFMIAGEGYTVDGVDQITFNENVYNTIKKPLAQKAAWEAANKKANEYGYEVTLPVKDLTIKKEED